MSTGSDLHGLRNLPDSSESGTDFVPPPPPEASLSASCEGPTSFSPNGNVFGVSGNTSVWRRTHNEASDQGAVVLGGSWPELSKSAKVSSKPSFDGPMCSATSPPTADVQRKVSDCGHGGNCGDGVGTSGIFSSNVGQSSSSTITNSVEMFNRSSEERPDKGSYSNWEHRPRESHGWVDQGDRQRRPGGNNYRANYGNRNYVNRSGNAWNSYRPLSIRDPYMPTGYLRPPVIRPTMPYMMPMVGHPPRFQHIYGPMAYPDFSSQMYILPTHPYPEHFRGYHFVPPLAPPAPPVQPPTFFSLHEHKCALILNQIEYYFSSENLLGDFFLRSHMDNHGWVSIHLIAGFKRIKMLTDNIGFILNALRPSRVVEVEGNRVRKRDGWHIWILNRSNGQSSTDSENRSQKTEDQEVLVSQMENIALGNEHIDSTVQNSDI